MANVGPLEVHWSLQAEDEEISCAEGGCAGCNGVHRRLTGRKWVEIQIAGHRYRAEVVPGTDGWEALNG